MQFVLFLGGEICINKYYPEDCVEEGREGGGAGDGDDPGEDDALEDAHVDGAETAAHGSRVNPSSGDPSTHQGHHLWQFQ